MASLFPQFGNVFGGASATGRNELVAFNAGKMTVEPTANGKFLISPDLKKGKICLTRGDDQLLHFQWIDRTTGASPEDFIIFPDDASFGKVDTGREGDRVYILQYKNSSRRFFFWMQNKDSSRDEELAKKVNDYMNNAQTGGSSSEGSRGNMNNVQLDHNAIVQMLGAMGAGEHGRNAGGAGTQSVQMSELQSILQNMGLPAGGQSAVSSPATSAVSSSQASQSGAGSSVAATTASTQHEHDISGMEVDEMDEDEMLRLAIEESMREANAPRGNGDNDNEHSGDQGSESGRGDGSASSVSITLGPSRKAQKDNSTSPCRNRTPASKASPTRCPNAASRCLDEAPSAAAPPASAAASTTTPAPVADPNPTPAPVVVPASAAPVPAITTADLQRAMASFQALAQPKPVSLTKLLRAENLSSVLQDPTAVERLVQHLPEGHQNRAELEATLRSPQLRQSIGSLVSALQTGNFNAVLTNFGLDATAGAGKLAFGDSLGAFLDAIQRWGDQQDADMSGSSSGGQQ